MRGYYGKAQTDDNIEQIKRDSFPTGTNIPYSIIMGDSGALLSATNQLEGVGSQVSGLSMGINILSSLTGSGTISAANLSLITQLAATLSGSGTITVASLVGITSLASSISSTGSLTAGLNVVAFMNSVLAGTSSVTAALRGTLSMEAHIYVNQSEETVQQIVDGVWNALAASYNATGTMGEKMNDAGSASNPWTEVLEGAYTAGEMLKLLTAVAAGKSTIVDLGGGLATVTFRDINDTVDRVQADMTDSERTSVTLNLT